MGGERDGKGRERGWGVGGEEKAYGSLSRRKSTHDDDTTQHACQRSLAADVLGGPYLSAVAAVVIWRILRKMKKIIVV